MRQQGVAMATPTQGVGSALEVGGGSVEYREADVGDDSLVDVGLNFHILLDRSCVILCP